MKKAYVKPVLYFENFELSSSIAVGCAKEVHTFAKGNCGIDIGDGIVAFIDGIQGCIHKPTNDGGKNQICYDNPNDSQRLFNSQ